MGSYMAFGITNAPRHDYQRWPDRKWFDMIHGYPTFVDEQGRPLIDDMVSMAWFATGRASAMAGAKPGVGSAYTWAYRDTNGDWLDPARTYQLRLPGPIPAKDFWSVVVYDLWTRSMLANGQPHPSVSTYSPGVQADDDGGVTLYIGPEPPTGKEAELDSHPAGHGLVPDHPPLRATRSLDRPQLETRTTSNQRSHGEHLGAVVGGRPLLTKAVLS